MCKLFKWCCNRGGNWWCIDEDDDEEEDDEDMWACTCGMNRWNKFGVAL